MSIQSIQTEAEMRLPSMRETRSSTRKSTGKKGATRKRDTGEGGLHALLQRLVACDHRVVVDHRRVSAERAAEQIEAFGKELVGQLRNKVEHAFAESDFRKAQWINPLTNPVTTGMAVSYWVHFELNIDTSVPWVDDPEWVRCENEDCPENAHNA